MDMLHKLDMSLEDLELNAKRPPGWRNRATILGSAVNIVVGFTGSSALATFYSLQGLANTLQIFALILSTPVLYAELDVVDEWRKVWLGTIPNILALNFANTALQSLVLLLIFMSISSLLLYYFYRSAIHCERYSRIEGLQKEKVQGRRWGLLVVTFVLTVIYLPLSTMAVHVIVWSQDLWIVPNPYINATSFPPSIPPLGPPAEYRDPLDFCWTTTMKKNEINFAPAVLILALIVLFSLTIWFPIAMHRVIQQSVPRVDRFNEHGRPRTGVEMDNQYHRLLVRDDNPFTFLYNGFRRGWGTFQAMYLFAKLSTLLIITLLDPANCLFRTLHPVALARILLARQILLLVSTIGFFAAQCIYAPFLDPTNNGSEWVSRCNYVLTAGIALILAVDVPKGVKDAFSDYVLYMWVHSTTALKGAD
jgi:hypothetical protein